MTPNDRGDPPPYDEGVAVCPNCGWVEHTSAEMSDCLEALMPEPVCVICEGPIDDRGHNAEPVAEGVCCARCNYTEVVPARFVELLGKAIDDEEET